MNLPPNPNNPIPRERSIPFFLNLSLKALRRCSGPGASRSDPGEAKRMASEIQKSSDPWDLEHYLPHAGSTLMARTTTGISTDACVFGKLLHEERLREKDLRGLREDKLKSIRSLAFLAEMDEVA